MQPALPLDGHRPCPAPSVVLALTLGFVVLLAGCAPRWTKRHEKPPRYREGPARPGPHRPADVTTHDRSREVHAPIPVPLSERAVPPSARGAAVADLAYELLGVPYLAGGDTPAGFDCSGLVHYLYRRQGVTLPRSTTELARVGRSVEREDLRAGDLVFFRVDGKTISHVGVFIEAVWFVHAPSSGDVVRLDAFDDPYWGPLYAGARRP